MGELTFLTEEQCFGDNKLDIFKIRGTKAAITDFSILLGGRVSGTDYIDNDSSLEERTGVYWTKSDNGMDEVRVVWVDGDCYFREPYKDDGGARPALPFSSISSIPHERSEWEKSK